MLWHSLPCKPGWLQTGLAEIHLSARLKGMLYTLGIKKVCIRDVEASGLFGMSNDGLLGHTVKGCFAGADTGKNAFLKQTQVKGCFDIANM